MQTNATGPTFEVIAHPKRDEPTFLVDRPLAGSIDVKAIRLAAPPEIGKSQRRFADAIGVPVMTLRNWEQHRRKPTGAALVLLLLLKSDPMLVLKCMNEHQELEPVA